MSRIRPSPVAPSARISAAIALVFGEMVVKGGGRLVVEMVVGGGGD